MRKLSTGWQRVLDLHDLPYFHAKDLWKPRSKLFRTLSTSKRKALLSKLVDHIHKRVDWGLSAYLNVDHYLTETTPRFRSQWGSPYTFAVRQIMNYLYVCLHRSNRAKEPINVLLERGHVNEQQALGMLDDYEGSLNIHTRGSGKKIGNPALQAADLLAYATCESLRGEHSKIREKLLSNPRPGHYELNCNGKIVELMKSTVEAVHARRKAEWRAASARLNDKTNEASH